MRVRALLSLTAAVLGLSAAPAAASPADASCDSGYCVWSGENYTGTKVVLTVPGLNKCFTPSAPGFDAARSANVTGDAFYLVFFSTTDCSGPGQTVMYQSVPSFPTPMRGIRAYLIRM
jgi:hypothetical protein